MAKSCQGYLQEFTTLDFVKHGSVGEVMVDGITGKRVEKSGIGSTAQTMAGTCPTELLYGSRGIPAAYRHPGSLGTHEPCPIGPRVTIDDTIRESMVEAREDRRHSERRVGTDMEDIVTFPEGSCGKCCHLRVPAEELDDVTSCSNGLETRCYRKSGLPKTSKGDAERAMEMTPSHVCQMFSGYTSDDAGAKPDFQAGRSHTAPNPEPPQDAERESLPSRGATTTVLTDRGDGEEVGRMDCDRTGDTVMAGGQERGAPRKLPRDCEGDDRHPDNDTKKAAFRKARSGDHCHCHHVDFLIRGYPRVGKDALIQKLGKSDDPSFRIVEDQAIFDNDQKTSRLNQEENEAKLESMLIQQQRVVDTMIQYLQTVEKRMRELENRAGIPMPVPGPSPDLPRDPAPEWLLRQVMTLRTAADGVAPMEGPVESAPYGPRQVDPSLLRHILPFSQILMLGEKTPEKCSRTCTPKQVTREETLEMDMTSPPAAATSDPRAAYAARVDKEASRSAARRDGSSRGAEDPWVRDPRSGVWTIGGPSVRGAEPRAREDTEIRGV